MSSSYGTGGVIKESLSVIINKFSDLAVSSILNVTDQRVIILFITILLYILFTYLSEFIRKIIMVDKKIEEIEYIVLDILRYIHIGLLFSIAELIKEIARNTINISSLKWYEIITLAVIILSLSFTIIRKYTRKR